MLYDKMMLYDVLWIITEMSYLDSKENEGIFHSMDQEDQGGIQTCWPCSGSSTCSATWELRRTQVLHIWNSWIIGIGMAFFAWNVLRELHGITRVCALATLSLSELIGSNRTIYKYDQIWTSAVTAQSLCVPRMKIRSTSKKPTLIGASRDPARTVDVMAM